MCVYMFLLPWVMVNGPALHRLRSHVTSKRCCRYTWYAKYSLTLHTISSQNDTCTLQYNVRQQSIVFYDISYTVWRMISIHVYDDYDLPSPAPARHSGPYARLGAARSRTPPHKAQTVCADSDRSPMRAVQLFRLRRTETVTVIPRGVSCETSSCLLTFTYIYIYIYIYTHTHI